MIFELRQYRIRNGQRERWVTLMEEEIIPFQASKGIVVVGSFVAEKAPDLYVWIRRFDNESERERLYKAVYDDSHWKNVIKPKIDTMLDRETIQVTRLHPTPRSVLRSRNGGPPESLPPQRLSLACARRCRSGFQKIYTTPPTRLHASCIA